MGALSLISGRRGIRPHETQEAILSVTSLHVSASWNNLPFNQDSKMAETLQFLSSPTYLFLCFSVVCDSLTRKMTKQHGRDEAKRKFDKVLAPELKKVIDELMMASLLLEALQDKETRLSA